MTLLPSPIRLLSCSATLSPMIPAPMTQTSAVWLVLAMELSSLPSTFPPAIG
eukprot:CAMPEP_0174947870 /NCGR_PEP_ID=MMETSP1355-20121228/87675_1 /TAXON_ID=464990 /ORGANISM="Hemiselmis tepida, Strain CCMP443" /LENGTH=51 /DNA_ID=CAMNT_0016195361 /DNA_START=20 /DNA_END=172 /DNA_ORIENTATION=-